MTRASHREPFHSGVLGGGITGKTHARHSLPIKNIDRGRQSRITVIEKKVPPPTLGLKVTVPQPWSLSPAAKVRGCLHDWGGCRLS